MNEVDGRYNGRPILKFLDSYVLDAMGVLDEKTRATLASQSAVISRALGVPEQPWQGAVEAALDMPVDSRETIFHMWTQANAGRSGEDQLSPMLFARELVDRRFGDGE